MPITFNASPTDVANEALGLCGKDPIIDLDNPDDPVAVDCLRYFSSLLRSLLRDHSWNFAHPDPIELAENATAPTAGFAHSFKLPTDCFRVLRVNDSDKVLWKIRGRDLFTDESTVIIDWIQWTDDPNIWDGSFYQAFVSLLGSRLASALNSDYKKAEELFKIGQIHLMDARAINGQEGSTDRMRCTALTDDIREG